MNGLYDSRFFTDNYRLAIQACGLMNLRPSASYTVPLPAGFYRLFKGECRIIAEGCGEHLKKDAILFANAGCRLIAGTTGAQLQRLELAVVKENSACPGLGDMAAENEQFRLFLSRQEPAVSVAADPSLTKLFDMISESSEDRFAGNLTVVVLMLSIVSRASTPLRADVQSRYISDACLYIRQHFTEKLLVEDIAGHLHLHPAYLQRIFKKECGITMMEYVTQCRIEEAKRQLTTTCLPIVEIAENVGINGRQYFSQLFKKHTGITPNEARNMALCTA